MPRALPNELRERAIAAKEAEGLSIAETAMRFMVGTASIKRWQARKKATGSIDPLAMGGMRYGWFGEEELARLKALVQETPDATIDEYRQTYNSRFGTEVSASAMHRALQNLGFTRKKRR
ncbi:MAG TPA: hypothetical protein PK095_07230 [Myxococcota bacterium]|nr:hypothetical protein [Myxococcota bacterium]